MDLIALRELCLKYDKEKGSWPESKYQGFSVFAWIARKGTPAMSDEEIETWYENHYETDEYWE